MQISPQLRLQDVIFASLYAIFPALDDENRVLRVWIQRYKDLLNSIQFFVPRAKFEKMVRKLLEPYKGETTKDNKPTPSLYKAQFWNFNCSMSWFSENQLSSIWISETQRFSQISFSKSDLPLFPSESEIYKTVSKLCQFCSKPIVQPSQKDKFPAQGLAHRRAKQRPNLQGDMCICSAKNESKLICAVCNFDDVQSERPPTDYQSK